MIEALASLDLKLFFLLNSWNAAWLNPVMVFVSSEILWAPLLILILLTAYRQVEKKSFYLFVLFLLMVIIASDVSSSYITKNLVKRLRPCRVAEIKEVMNYFGQKCGGRFGFVSSHASNSIGILIFSYFALKLWPRSLHFLWLVPGIVCLSRIYLGVHYPGDILGGLAIGTFWGIIFAWFFKSHESWGKSG